MKNKYLISSAVVAILAVAAILLIGGKSGSPIKSSLAPTSPPPMDSGVAAVSTTPPDSETSAVMSYTDAGFVPDSLSIQKGTTVIFKNESLSNFWPASNPHPIHTGYPTTGGCTGSTFDACGPIPSGGSWSFKFDIAGTWGFHNHLNPTQTGKIIVQ